MSINILPNAIYKPERCIKTTLEAAKQYDFPVEQIMFEFTEVEKVYEAAMVWASVINYAEDELAENAVVRLFRTTAK